MGNVGKSNRFVGYCYKCGSLSIADDIGAVCAECEEGNCRAAPEGGDFVVSPAASVCRLEAAWLERRQQALWHEVTMIQGKEGRKPLREIAGGAYAKALACIARSLRNLRVGA